MTPKLLNILLLTLSYVLYHYFVGPLYTGDGTGLWSPGENNIKSLRALNSSYTATIDEANKLVSQAKILQKQYDSYDEATLHKLEIMVPDKVDTLVLLDELNRLMSDSGPVDTLGVKDKGNGEYQVSFTVYTTYTKFKQFITYWEKSMRLFSLQTVNFSPGKKEEEVVKFTVEFTTYYMDIPAKASRAAKK